MNFSDFNVKKVTEHTNTLVSLFRFEDNDVDHYLSLSDDGQLKEWLFDKSNGASKEIDQCVLIRPSEDLLRENKHKIPKLRKNDYLKITKSILFGHFIVLGYEDGLVLVYSQELQKGVRQHFNMSKQQEQEEDCINNEEGDKHIKEEEEGNEEGACSPHNKAVSKGGFSTKKYYNAFSLYFILLGHSQRITCLYYVKAKNTLITASDNYIVKIYDMETGYSLYHFNLDCIVSQVIFINESKKQELVFLCQEPYKLVIDISQEPFSFNHYTFKYNNINQLFESESRAVLLPGRSSNFYWFSPTMEYKEEVKEASKDSFEYMMQYRGNYLVFDDKMKMRLVDITLKQGESSMKTLFKIPIGRDSIAQGMIIGTWGVMACQDGSVYSVELEKELALYWNRSRMNEEDKGSELMNKALDSKKGKKGMKGKKEAPSKGGKGGKEKKEEKLPKIQKSTSKPKGK